MKDKKIFKFLSTEIFKNYKIPELSKNSELLVSKERGDNTDTYRFKCSVTDTILNLYEISELDVEITIDSEFRTVKVFIDSESLNITIERDFNFSEIRNWTDSRNLKFTKALDSEVSEKTEHPRPFKDLKIMRY